MIKEEFVLPHDEVMCLLIKHKGDANAAVLELLNNFQWLVQIIIKYIHKTLSFLIIQNTTITNKSYIIYKYE